MPHDDDILEGDVVDHTSTPRPRATGPSPLPPFFLQLNQSCLTGCLVFVALALLVTLALGWFVLLIPLALVGLAWWLARGRLRK